MDADFCVEELQEAIGRYGCPSIFNTDQGSQFTSVGWIDKLKANNIDISLDGQCVYRAVVALTEIRMRLPEALDNMQDGKEKLNFWIEYYNYERPHSSLNDQPPNEFYEGIEPALTGSIMIMSDSTLRTLSYCPINGVHFRYGSPGPRY